MAGLDFSVLYTNGDSWTAGDIVDPDRFGDQLQHVMHPDNDSYRLPKVWPHKVGNLLNIEVINKSYAGSSNDRIVRTTINDVLGLLKTYNADKLFVVIGWSSPERKDFYFKEGTTGGVWDCVYPAELAHWKDEKNLIRNEFYKYYVLGYWNDEEYLTRHFLNTIFLHTFLNSLGIRHLFFDAFYENREGVINPNKHQLYDQPVLIKYIEDFLNKQSETELKNLGINNTVQNYLSIYENFFFKKSFIGLLKETSQTKNIKLNDLIDFHPKEAGHDLWAKYIANTITQ